VLSPVEIKKQEFSRSVRGYDIEEVRSFLETVADELDKLSDRNRTATAELDKLKAELDSFRRLEQNLKEALVSAQETLRETRDGSKREADLIKREAELEADKIVSAAHKRSEDLRRDLETLASRRDAIVRKLKSLLRSELDLIEILEGGDIFTHASTEANAISPND